MSAVIVVSPVVAAALVTVTAIVVVPTAALVVAIPVLAVRIRIVVVAIAIVVVAPVRIVAVAVAVAVAIMAAVIMAAVGIRIVVVGVHIPVVTGQGGFVVESIGTSGVAILLVLAEFAPLFLFALLAADGWLFQQIVLGWGSGSHAHQNLTNKIAQHGNHRHVSRGTEPAILRVFTKVFGHEQEHGHQLHHECHIQEHRGWQPTALVDAAEKLNRGKDQAHRGQDGCPHGTLLSLPEELVELVARWIRQNHANLDIDEVVGISSGGSRRGRRGWKAVFLPDVASRKCIGDVIVVSDGAIGRSPCQDDCTCVVLVVRRRIPNRSVEDILFEKGLCLLDTIVVVEKLRGKFLLEQPIEKVQVVLACLLLQSKAFQFAIVHGVKERSFLLLRGPRIFKDVQDLVPKESYVRLGSIFKRNGLALVIVREGIVSQSHEAKVIR